MRFVDGQLSKNGQVEISGNIYNYATIIACKIDLE